MTPYEFDKDGVITHRTSPFRIVEAHFVGCAVCKAGGPCAEDQRLQSWAVAEIIAAEKRD